MQPSAADDHIRALWDLMAAGWAAGSGEQFAQAFASDVDFVSMSGESLLGQREVAMRHDRLFQTTFQDTHLASLVYRVRRLSPCIVVVHARSDVIGVNRSVVVSAHAQAVIESHDGPWRIVAFHNMLPARPPLPAREGG